MCFLEMENWFIVRIVECSKMMLLHSTSYSDCMGWLKYCLVHWCCFFQHFRNFWLNQSCFVCSWPNFKRKIANSLWHTSYWTLFWFIAHIFAFCAHDIYKVKKKTPYKVIIHSNLQALFTRIPFKHKFLYLSDSLGPLYLTT